MTQELFNWWYLRVFVRFIKENYHDQIKCLLIMDNCKSHKVEEWMLQDPVRIAYLPAGTTSCIQPCDQGIINALKAIILSGRTYFK